MYFILNMFLVILVNTVSEMSLEKDLRCMDENGGCAAPALPRTHIGLPDLARMYMS